MVINKKKVFYTTFAALLLSGFSVHTGQADEVSVAMDSDQAKVDAVLVHNDQMTDNGEVRSETTSETMVLGQSSSETVSSSEVATTIITSSSEVSQSYSAVVGTQEIDYSTASDIAEASATGSYLASQVASLAVQSESAELASSEISSQVRLISETDSENVTTSIVSHHQVTTIPGLDDHSLFYKSERLTYTSELPVSDSLRSESEIGSETEMSDTLKEGAVVLRSIASSESSALSQSEHWMSSEIASEAMEIFDNPATTLSSEEYSVTLKRDSNGHKWEQERIVSGNIETVYLTYGDTLDVQFTVPSRQIKGIRLILDGQQIYHSYFDEGILTHFSGGLNAKDLASQKAGLHKLTFALLADNGQDQYVTQVFDLLDMSDKTEVTSVSATASTSEQALTLQSESTTFASEVILENGSTSEIIATPISSEIYTVVPTRDSSGSELLNPATVVGNTDILYVARGEDFNVKFDVEKKNIKGINLVLDGKKVYHSYFDEGVLPEINAGLDVKDLAEQTTGVHTMTFELIDANNNIHYLTQTFSVFDAGQQPVTPYIYTPNTGTTDYSNGTYNVNVTYNYNPVSYTDVANQIQTVAVGRLAETTRSFTQQLAEQIAEMLGTLSSNMASHASSSGTTDIFQAVGNGAVKAAKKIAETVADPDVFGKQALAAASVVLVLLILYLAAIAFI